MLVRLLLIPAFSWCCAASLGEHQCDDEAVVRRVSARSSDMVALAEASEYGGASSLEALLRRIQAEPSEDGMRELVTGVVNCSLQRERALPRKYVEEDIVVYVLANALHYPDSSVRNLALRYLTDNVRNRGLDGYAPTFIDAWSHLQSEKLLLILGGLDAPEATEFLSGLVEQGSAVPEEVRARLGDEELERALIGRFQGSSDPEEKGELALELGYVGTHGCTLELALALRTPLVHDEPYLTYSVRYMVLRGLGRAHPDERLFNEDLEAAVLATKNISSAEEAEQRAPDYFERAEAWCQDRFGVEWDTPRPEFLLWRQKRVPR